MFFSLWIRILLLVLIINKIYEFPGFYKYYSYIFLYTLIRRIIIFCTFVVSFDHSKKIVPRDYFI
jgi:hypothetical protein